MSKNNVPLGKLAEAGAGRDAVHIAVAPVVAGEMLSPGEHVGILEDGKAVKMNLTGNNIGIVDPYLTEPVKPGERFYLCLYPNTVESLRHHWVHHAFKDEVPAASVAQKLPVPAPDKAASEAWLREYANKVNPYYAEGGHYYKPEYDAYAVLMEDLSGNTVTYHGVDMHSLYDLIDAEELRHHASIVLGKDVRWENFEYFSCSC